MLEDINVLVKDSLDPQRLLDRSVACKYEIIRNVCKGAIYTQGFEDLVISYCLKHRPEEANKILEYNKISKLTKLHFPFVRG